MRSVEERSPWKWGPSRCVGPPHFFPLFFPPLLQMVVYACLARLADGTPLAASTDLDADADRRRRVAEGKKCVRGLSGRMPGPRGRLCLQAEEVTVHCVADECTAYVAVCEPNYPHILAFSFLDELMREFNVLYTASVVKSVRRPYAFIEFDTFLQKTRQKYNSTRSLASRLNLAEMTTDLNLHPPSYIKMHQLEPSPSSVSVSSNSSGRHTPNALNLSNGTLANGTVPRDISTVGVTLRLRPVPWYGWLAIFLAIPCVLLDVYRGAVAISMSSLEDPDGPSPWHGVFFLMETLLQIAQVHMLWKYNKFRKLGTLGCAVFVLVLTVFLLDVREGWLCFVYVLVSLTLMIATFCRPFERKLPRFHV